MIITAHLSRFLERLAKPLLVICVLMLAVGPIADGLVCGSEPASAEVEMLKSDLGGDDDIATGIDHAVCAHGHCHDAPPLANGGEAHVTSIRYVEAEAIFSVSVQPPSATQPTLKRPPRV